jgi:hypothetical protein
MNQSSPQLFGILAGLFLAAGLVCSAMLGTSAWVNIKNSQFITIKGSVQKDIESDLAIWSGSFLVEAEMLLDAQHKVQANRAVVAKFLGDSGVTNFTFAPISIEELKTTQKSSDGFISQHTTGYHLTQSVAVESADVGRLDKLDATPLVEQGVIFTVAPLHDADQGIFQITPQHSVATSWQGESDTGSRAKTITAVVTATFLLK